MNVLFASSEVAPFAKTGGLADVSGSLPMALNAKSFRVTVIMPFYRSVKEMNLPGALPFSTGEFKFLRYTKDGTEYVFVINDEYYQRDNLYSEPDGDYPDNDMRFSYFDKAIVAFATESDFTPEVIHLNDWQTGLVPVYLKMRGAEIKTLFTIHNIAYQGLFKKEALSGIGLPRKFYNINGIEYYGKISFLKAGIVYSSAISTVSKGYAREILTREFGCGMDGILRTRLPHVYGILNGVDYKDWDPRIDNHIAEKYGPDTLDGKAECKKDLIKTIALTPEAGGRPLIGVISRLAEQKGIDLIVNAVKEISVLGASVVILGTGDERYNNLCRAASESIPQHISCHIKFDNELAHKIEAGSDMFLMPSRYEPCGLNQLYSMRYGTLPVVRATGGLDDTVVDLSKNRENGNGIKFPHAAKKEMLDGISRAIEIYKNKSEWQKIQKRIMKLDFSWKSSAQHYKDLYTKL